MVCACGTLQHSTELEGGIFGRLAVGLRLLAAPIVRLRLCDHAHLSYIILSSLTGIIELKLVLEANIAVRWHTKAASFILWINHVVRTHLEPATFATPSLSFICPPSIELRLGLIVSTEASWLRDHGCGTLSTIR